MKKADLFLIFAILIVSFAAFLGIYTLKTPGDTVIIEKSGEILYEKSLCEDSKIDIDGKNIVIIENGEVYMEYADCPDGLCVNMGKTSDSSKKIICLPNKVTVSVTKKSGIDAVVR